MDIKILVDTGADLYKEELEKYNIGLLSYRSIFGEEVYKTGVDLTNEEFFEKLEASDTLPTTSQTPPMEMYETFKEAGEKHDAVIYFCLSGSGSGQYSSALMMKEQLEEENPDIKLYIVDTQSYSLFIGVTAIYATELAAQGLEPEEIIEKSLEYMNKWYCMLVVGDLKYLQKGGRIKKTVAVLGTMLDIKPVLTISDGVIDVIEKLRGSKKIMAKLIGKLEDNNYIDKANPEFIVLHSDDEKGAELKEKLEETYGAGTVKMIHKFGPIIGTHVGTGAFAVISRYK